MADWLKLRCARFWLASKIFTVYKNLPYGNADSLTFHLRHYILLYLTNQSLCTRLVLYLMSANFKGWRMTPNNRRGDYKCGILLFQSGWEQRTDQFMAFRGRSLAVRVSLGAVRVKWEAAERFGAQRCSSCCWSSLWSAVTSRTETRSTWSGSTR